MTFTIVLPIKGTKQEMDYIERSLKSAFALNPGEIIIPMDHPQNPFLLAELDKVEKKYNHDHKKNIPVKHLFVKKDESWNFQLAKIVWEAYSEAKFDKIFSFDIDAIARKEILLGINDLSDEVALVSFTKKLYIGSISDAIRYLFYRMRVKTTESVFTGNYWVNKKLFFELVDKAEYQKINNGVDSYIIKKIEDSKYTMINRKEKGVTALNKQNEDYDWRQFQDGMWLYAHREEVKTGKLSGTLKAKFILKRPKLLAFIKSFAYQRPHIYKGYCWAEKNPESLEMKMAKFMSLYEWQEKGSVHLPKIKFKDTGTGHKDY